MLNFGNFQILDYIKSTFASLVSRYGRLVFPHKFSCLLLR